MTQSAPAGFVADVGGTNARFALVWRDGNGHPTIGEKTTLPTADFPTFSQCALHWLSTLPADHRPDAASLAFAGPIIGDHVSLTNRAWSFQIPVLQAELGLKCLRVINDFAAIAYSLPLVRQQGWFALPGPAWPTEMPRVVTILGPGTGLGVSMMLSLHDRRMVIATEGGHTSFAPVDPVEMELLRILTLRHGRVSFERFISGPGLKRLHQSLASIHGWSDPEREPAEIAEAALAGADRLCVESIERFCLILATVAGDLALAQGGNAVAIAGGISPKILPFLSNIAVRERFNAKGRSRELMQAIPMAVIVEPDPGLLGAAANLTNAYPGAVAD